MSDSEDDQLPLTNARLSRHTAYEEERTQDQDRLLCYVMDQCRRRNAAEPPYTSTQAPSTELAMAQQSHTTSISPHERIQHFIAQSLCKSYTSRITLSQSEHDPGRPGIFSRVKTSRPLPSLTGVAAPDLLMLSPRDTRSNKATSPTTVTASIVSSVRSKTTPTSSSLSQENSVLETDIISSDQDSSVGSRETSNYEHTGRQESVVTIPWPPHRLH